MIQIQRSATGIGLVFLLSACGSGSNGSSGPGGGKEGGKEGGTTGNTSGGTTDNSGGATLGGTTGGGGSQSGGNGGDSTGGITHSGGTTGGTVGSGGTRASGGVLSGGNTNSGGRVATGGASLSGGATASGGAPASGGTTASGGIVGSGGKTDGDGGSGGTTTPAYQGPCDLLANGCAEAYGMARAMTVKYTGPLFQLGLANDTSKTLDIGQTADHKTDMTTWSAFCGGKESNCVVSKVYGQIHKGNNDLLPAVWKAPWGPDCSAGGFKCAAKFTIEAATGLPILTTDAPQEYALRNGNSELASTGINAGKTAMGLMYNGKPVPNQVYCCGVFGLTHKYNEEDVHGTDFMVALAYGWRDSGGCCIAVNCSANNKYCVGAEEEENNDLYDYGSSPVENALVMTQYDPSKNAVLVHLNGTQVLSKSPPKANLNVGKSIHVGGGGDLSQPDPVRMREGIISNYVMTASEVAAIKTNVTTFFSTLKFP